MDLGCFLGILRIDPRTAHYHSENPSPKQVAPPCHEFQFLCEEAFLPHSNENSAGTKKTVRTGKKQFCWAGARNVSL